MEGDGRAVIRSIPASLQSGVPNRDRGRTCDGADISSRDDIAEEMPLAPLSPRRDFCA
jgi:hypothetical protein